MVAGSAAGLAVVDGAAGGGKVAVAVAAGGDAVGAGERSEPGNGLLVWTG